MVFVPGQVRPELSERGQEEQPLALVEADRGPSGLERGPRNEVDPLRQIAALGVETLRCGRCQTVAPAVAVEKVVEEAREPRLHFGRAFEDDELLPEVLEKDAPLVALAPPGEATLPQCREELWLAAGPPLLEELHAGQHAGLAVEAGVAEEGVAPPPGHDPGPKDGLAGELGEGRGGDRHRPLLVVLEVAQQHRVLVGAIYHPQGEAGFGGPAREFGVPALGGERLGHREPGRIEPLGAGKIEQVRPLVRLGRTAEKGVGGGGHGIGLRPGEEPDSFAGSGEEVEQLRLGSGRVYTASIVMPALLLLELVACDPDQALNVAEPKLVIEPPTVEFGETVLGTYTEVGAVIRNDGLGSLTISGAELQSGSSTDFQLVSWPESLKGKSEGLLVMQYTPDIEGEDWGTIQLSTNEGDNPEPQFSVTGLGVKPCIDIDPELLWFGVVPPGESVTKSFTVRAGCTGTLQIGSVVVPGDEASAYTITYPEGWSEPYALRTGFSFTMQVTFAPPDDTPREGEIWFNSNDPESPTAAVSLKGNTVDDPTENEPPVVEITEPDVGEYFLDNQLVTVLGAVYDADEAVTNLICGWYANGSRLPDADATVLIDGSIVGATLLPLGDVDLELRCFDSEGLQGKDTTSVKVFAHEEPLDYVISGGSTSFDYFGVDDDVRITVAGLVVFDDNNDTKDNLAPVRFSARAGDALQITAVDQNSCDARIDALVLHWGTGQQQALNEAVCLSSCPEHDCYDGTYAGPWPSVILDESFTVSIP